MLLSLVEQVAYPQQQPQEDVFYLHFFINLSQINKPLHQSTLALLLLLLFLLLLLLGVFLLSLGV